MSCRQTRPVQMPSRPHVTVVVPTLNEVGNIDLLLERLLMVSRCHGLNVEVIVVDDGSSDGTPDLVRHWSKRHPVHLVERPTERGLTGAVLRGAELASNDVVVVMDADLSHPPEAIPSLIDPIRAGEHDLVIGSRYVTGGSIVGWPRRRRVVSRVATALAWPLADVKDPMSGFFAVRRAHLLAHARAEARGGFKILFELLAGDEELRVAEVPIEFTERVEGETKLTAGVASNYLRRLVELAGGTLTTRSSLRFGAVGIGGMLVDAVAFGVMWNANFGMAASHIGAFLVAAMFNFVLNAVWAFRLPGAASTRLSWTSGVRFLFVATLALLLRGGVLSMLSVELGLPVPLSLVGAIGFAAIVNLVGCAFFVFPRDASRGQHVLNWRVAAFGVVGFLTLVRVVYAGTVDLLPEEAYYWNYAQHPALSYLDHPPMVAWLIAAGTSTFGDTEFGVRAGAIVCWVATSVFAFLLARDMVGKSAAIVTLLLLAALPFYFAVGLIMTPDAPLTACWAGALFFTFRAIVLERRRAWWGIGVCVGLGLLSKYTIAPLGPVALIVLLSDRESRRWLRRPEPWCAAAIAGLLFTPVLVWNATHDWSSFVFQGTRRWTDDPEFSLHLLIGSAGLLLTPIGLAAAIGVFVRSRGVGQPGSGQPCHRARTFALAATGVPLLVFVVFSLSHEPKLNWTGPVWLGVLPLIAAEIVAFPKLKSTRLDRIGHRLWRPTIAASMLLYVTALHYFAIGLPGPAYVGGLAVPLAWEELAIEVESLEERIEGDTGDEPLVVGLDKYFMTSQMAFYRTKVERDRDDSARDEGVEETTGRHLFGMSSLMYEHWAPVEEFMGRTVIVLATNSEALSHDAIQSSFESLGPVQQWSLAKGGKSVTEIHYRVGYGYCGGHGRSSAAVHEPSTDQVAQVGFPPDGAGVDCHEPMPICGRLRSPGRPAPPGHARLPSADHRSRNSRRILLRAM